MDGTDDLHSVAYGIGPALDCRLDTLFILAGGFDIVMYY